MSEVTPSPAPSAAPSPAMTTLCAALGLDTGPVGADESVRLACWMLAATRPWPGEVAETMAALVAAHCEVEVEGGGAAVPSIWRRLRRDAVALGDSTDPDIRAYGRVAEAAAWPLATTRAGLVEMMQAICSLRGVQASRAAGWTSWDEEEAHATLTRIAAGDGGPPPAREDIPGLFMAADPQLERRFFVNLGAVNAAFAGFRTEVVAWIAGASR